MCHIVGAVVGIGVTIEEVIFQSIYYMCGCKKLMLLVINSLNLYYLKLSGKEIQR